MSGQDSPSHVSLGLVGRSIRSLTQRDASPIFSASRATWRIVWGETVDPYCGRAIPIETFGLADRLGGADHYCPKGLTPGFKTSARGRTSGLSRESQERIGSQRW